MIRLCPEECSYTATGIMQKKNYFKFCSCRKVCLFFIVFYMRHIDEFQKHIMLFSTNRGFSSIFLLCIYIDIIQLKVLKE